MQVAASLLYHNNPFGRASIYSGKDEEDDTSELTRAESIARGMEEQSKLDQFWIGIKRVVDSQALRKSYQRFSDLNKELERKNKNHRRQSVIRPDHPVKISWDVFMFGLTMYSVILAFFSIGFDSEPSLVVTDFDYLVTVAFGMDIITSFNTGYIDEETGQFIADRGQIAAKYLQFWFWIDLIATIPFDSILPLFIGNNSNVTVIRMIRFVRILRIAKIYKLLDKDGFISKLKMNPQLLQLIILIVELFFVAHMFACFWHFIALPENSNRFFENWITQFNYQESCQSDRYLTSLYFIIVTMLTIGYGDIYPTNQLERIYAIGTMMTGVIVFSTLMSKVASLIEKLNPQATLQAGKVEELKAFLLEIQLPRHLREVAKAQYSYYYEKKALLDEVGISILARPMLITLIKDLYNDDIQSIPLFGDLNSQVFTFTMAYHWQPFFAVAGDVLYKKGDVFRKMILIRKGRVRISNVIETVESNKYGSGSIKTPAASLSFVKGTATVIGGLYDGEYFGEMEYLKTIPCLAHYSAVINCSLFSVDHGVVNSFCSEEQDLGQQLHAIFTKRYDTMTKVMKSSRVVRFQRSSIRFQDLDIGGEPTKYIAFTQKKLYINGHRVQCDRYFHDFMEVSLKDGKEGLELAEDNEISEDTVTASDFSYEDEDEKVPMLRVLIPNPLREVNLQSVVMKGKGTKLNNSVANNAENAEMIVVELPLSTLREKYLLHPEGRLKTMWDLIIAFVVIISVFIIPIQIAFLYEAFPGMDTFNYVIVCFFGVDIFFTFRTIIESKNNDAYIIATDKIAWNYFKGWFLIDLVSTLPFNVIALFTNVSSSTLVLFQLFKFLRLLWLFKLKRVAKTVESIEDHTGIPPAISKLVKLFFKVYFIVHIMACIWWGVTRCISAHPWFENSGPGGFFYGRLTDVHVSAQYLMSLYFAFTTMSTVGYGDIHQVNPAERFLSIPYIIVSASVFGFMLATVSSVMNSLSESSSIATDKIALITEYLKEKKCTKDLNDQIIYYFQRHLKEDTGYDVDAITANLPDYLNYEILYLFYSKKLKKVLFFKFVENKSVQIYLYRLLKPVFYEANCYVITEGEELNSNIYFVIAGMARVFRYLRNTKGKTQAQIGRRRRRQFSSTPAEQAKRSLEAKEDDEEEVEDSQPTERNDQTSQTSPRGRKKSGGEFEFSSIYPRSSYIPVNTKPTVPDPELEDPDEGGIGVEMTEQQQQQPPPPPPSSSKKRRSSSTPISIPVNVNRFSARRSSVVAKEQKIKIQDMITEYARKKRKIFLDFTPYDFTQLGIKLLADLTSSDFFGYTQFMEEIESTASVKRSALFSASPVSPMGTSSKSTKPPIVERKFNKYSIKTALESSFLVLEKIDLLNLVRREPLIAMQLQMALAKSICIQSNDISQNVIQNAKKFFIHRLKRDYDRRQSKKKLEKSSSEFITHLNTQRNRRLQRKSAAKRRKTNEKNYNTGEMEDSLDGDGNNDDLSAGSGGRKSAAEAEEDNSKVPLTRRVQRYFSKKYQKIRKMTKQFISHDHHEGYEGNWETPIEHPSIDPASAAKSLLSSRFSSKQQQHDFINRTTPFPTAQPIRRSYSLNDLEVFSSNDYLMQYSIVTKEFTANPRDLLASYSSKKNDHNSNNSSNNASNSNSSKKSDGTAPLIGILRVEPVRRGSTPKNSAKRKKSVTFRDEEPPLHFLPPPPLPPDLLPPPPPQYLPRSPSPPSSSNEMVLGTESSSASLQPPARDFNESNGTSGRTEDENERKDNDDEGNSSKNAFPIAPRIDLSISIPRPTEIEYRPRSLSFPFTSYQRWKLHQSKQYQI